MHPYQYSRIKFSLPLFCLLSWSWAVSSTTAFHPPASSALLAADTLRTRGYSIFASIIASVATTNFSGTLLVPPDFAFSFAAAKFLNNHSPPPQPSISLLLYHTLKPPLILTWPTLSSRDNGDELRTLYTNTCLYLFRNLYSWEVSISSSPFKSPNAAVKIRQPDLYVDDQLTVHGIDGILDPSSANKCSVSHGDPTAEAIPRKVNRTFLDHAMRRLRRKGYNVVAAAMAIRRSQLLSLTSVTVFAVSDVNLFLKPGGFRYDFLHHVVPMRHRIADLGKSTADGRELNTMAPKKTIHVDPVDGTVSVDGIAVNGTEIYHNRWIVVVAVEISFDDVVYSQANPLTTGALPVSDKSAPYSTPFPSVSGNGNLSSGPSPAPAYDVEPENGIPSLAPANLPNSLTDVNSEGTPSPASKPDRWIRHDAPSFAPDISAYGFVNSISSPSPAPEIGAVPSSVSSPAPSPVKNDVSETQCDINTGVLIGIEGEDLLCPGTTLRQLQETEILSDVRVEESEPFNAHSPVAENKVKIAENVNSAEDLFFYV